MSSNPEKIKTKKFKYSQDQLEQALLSIESGMKVRMLRIYFEFA